MTMLHPAEDNIDLSIVSTVDPGDGISSRFLADISRYFACRSWRVEAILVDDLDKGRQATTLTSFRTPSLDVILLCMCRHAGQLAATLEGLRHARGRMILVMDTDMTGNIDDIGRFIEQIEAGCEVVMAHRLQREGIGPTHRAASHLLNRLAMALGQTPLRDVNTPMLMFTRHALVTLAALPPESRFHKLFLARRFRHACAEIPIMVVRTKPGSSYRLRDRVLTWISRVQDMIAFNRYWRQHEQRPGQEQPPQGPGAA